MSIVHTETERGFRWITNDTGDLRIQESSAIGDYVDSFDCPGSSFLWVGDAHLCREDVADLIKIMGRWLETKRLPTESDLDDS